MEEESGSSCGACGKKYKNNKHRQVHNSKCIKIKANAILDEEKQLSKRKTNDGNDLIQNEKQSLNKDTNKNVKNKENGKAQLISQLTGPSLLERFEHYKRNNCPICDKSLEKGDVSHIILEHISIYRRLKEDSEHNKPNNGIYKCCKKEFKKQKHLISHKYSDSRCCKTKFITILNSLNLRQIIKEEEDLQNNDLDDNITDKESLDSEMDVDDSQKPDNDDDNETTEVQDNNDAMEITNATDNNTVTKTTSSPELNTHDALNKRSETEIATSDCLTDIDDNSANGEFEVNSADKVSFADKFNSAVEVSSADKFNSADKVNSANNKVNSADIKVNSADKDNSANKVNAADEVNFADEVTRNTDESNTGAEKVTKRAGVSNTEAEDSTVGLSADEIKDEPYYFIRTEIDTRARSDTETSATDTDGDVGAKDILEFKDEPLIGSGYDSPNEIGLGEIQFSNEYSVNNPDKMTSPMVITESNEVPDSINKDQVLSPEKEKTGVIKYQPTKWTITGIKTAEALLHANAEKGVFPCTQCDKKYESLRSLDVHIARIHDEKNFTCLDCGAKLKSQDNLNRHKFTHQKKKFWPHGCPIKTCNQRFQCKGDIPKHVKSKIHENDDVPEYQSEEWYELYYNKDEVEEKKENSKERQKEEEHKMRSLQNNPKYKDRRMSGESSSSRMDTSDQEDLVLKEQSMPLQQTSTENEAMSTDKEHSRSLPQTSENGVSTETYENNWLTWNHVLDIKPIENGYFLVKCGKCKLSVRVKSKPTRKEDERQTLRHVIEEHACRTQGYPDLQTIEDNPTDVQKIQLACLLCVVPFDNKPVFKDIDELKLHFLYAHSNRFFIVKVPLVKSNPFPFQCHLCKKNRKDLNSWREILYHVGIEHEKLYHMLKHHRFENTEKLLKRIYKEKHQIHKQAEKRKRTTSSGGSSSNNSKENDDVAVPVPGTSSGNPGTSSGNPGTSSGKPETNSAKPGTSSAKPGTSSANPGASSGKPGSHKFRRPSSAASSSKDTITEDLHGFASPEVNELEQERNRLREGTRRLSGASSMSTTSATSQHGFSAREVQQSQDNREILRQGKKRMFSGASSCSTASQRPSSSCSTPTERPSLEQSSCQRPSSSCSTSSQQQSSSEVEPPHGKRRMLSGESDSSASSSVQQPPNYPTGRIITPHNTYKCTICPTVDEDGNSIDDEFSNEYHFRDHLASKHFTLKIDDRCATPEFERNEDYIKEIICGYQGCQQRFRNLEARLKHIGNEHGLVDDCLKDPSIYKDAKTWAKHNYGLIQEACSPWVQSQRIKYPRGWRDSDDESDQEIPPVTGRRAGTPMPSPRPYSDEEESDQDIPLVNDGEGMSSEFQCPKCGTGMASQETLRIHVCSELQCRQCGAEMPTKETLKLHDCNTRISSPEKRTGGRKLSHSSEASAHSSSGSTSKASLNSSTCGTSPRPLSAVSCSLAETISADVRSVPRPSADVRSVHKPPADVRSGYKPPADVRSVYKPSADVRSVHKPSADVRSVFKPSADVQPGPGLTASVRPKSSASVRSGPITVSSASLQPVPGSSALLHDIKTNSDKQRSRITLESGGAESSSDDSDEEIGNIVKNKGEKEKKVDYTNDKDETDSMDTEKDESSIEEEGWGYVDDTGKEIFKKK